MKEGCWERSGGRERERETDGEREEGEGEGEAVGGGVQRPSTGSDGDELISQTHD